MNEQLKPSFAILLICYIKGMLPIGSKTFGRRCLGADVGAATKSMQLLDSRVHSSLVVAYSRVRPTRTQEYFLPYSWWTLEYVLPRVGYVVTATMA